MVLLGLRVESWQVPEKQRDRWGRRGGGLGGPGPVLLFFLELWRALMEEEILSCGTTAVAVL